MSAVGTVPPCELRGAVRRVPGAAYLLLSAFALAYFATTLTGNGSSPAAATVALAIAFSTAALTLLRAATHPRERAAWAAIGAALALWATGDLLVRIQTSGGRDLAIPSIADLFYIAFYPCIALGLVLLLRARVRVVSPVIWLDGLVAALAIAAGIALLVVDPLADVTGDTIAQTATNIAYPAADLLVAVCVAGWLAVRCGRLSRDVLLLTTGLLVSAVADVAYLFETASGPYDEGGPLTNAYLLASLMVGWSAWQRSGPIVVLRESGHRVFVPVAAGAACIVVLVADHHQTVETAAVWLAAAGLSIVLVRFVVTFRAAQRLLAERAGQALTDPLTGLGNRRALSDELDVVAAGGREEAERVVVLLDLDGFKRFNDTHGHGAGDELLERAGARLGAVARAAGGAAYRLGGDEFCLLAPAPPGGDHDPLLSAAVAALDEAGGVPASGGAATLAPGADPRGALDLADARMYAHKSARRG